jgi:acetyl esterase/lipase
MKRRVMVGLILLCGASVYAAPKKAAGLANAGDSKVDVVYKQVGERGMKLDLYYPKNRSAEKLPVIFYTHGGGWAAGNHKGVSNASFGKVFNQLLDAGFCVATVEYRLWKKEGQSMMRDCVIDCKDGMRFIAKNSEAWGVDPMRFFVLGDSAGGQIAQLLLFASAESLPGEPALAGVNYKMVGGVSWYGPCDFEKSDLFNHDDRAKFKDRFGARIYRGNPTKEEKLALYREMSPINYMTKDSAPLLMIQGDMDTTIPVKHAYYMQERLKTVPAPVEIMIIKNAGHNWREAKKGVAIEPDRNAIIAKTVKYLTTRLSEVNAK